MENLTPEEIATAGAFKGLTQAIEKRGGNPARMEAEIRAYAVHGRITGTDAEFDAVADRLLSNYSESGSERESRIRDTLSGKSESEHRPDFESRQTELKKMGLL